MPNGKKVVLVTGASRGLGNASANLLAENNYTVYGASRNLKSDKDQSSKDLFNKIKMDVTDSESVRNGVNKIIEEQGRIDILINNAGIVLAGPLEQTLIEEAKLQLDTNFFGTARACKTVLPHMRKQKSGLIINISYPSKVFIALPNSQLKAIAKRFIKRFTHWELTLLSLNQVIMTPINWQTGS